MGVTFYGSGELSIFQTKTFYNEKDFQYHGFSGYYGIL